MDGNEKDTGQAMAGGQDDALVSLIECDRPKKINKYSIRKSIKFLKTANLLVLCKEELFFQDKNGNSITVIYPVSKEAAVLIAYFLNKPVMSA